MEALEPKTQRSLAQALDPERRGGLTGSRSPANVLAPHSVVLRFPDASTFGRQPHKDGHLIRRRDELRNLLRSEKEAFVAVILYHDVVSFEITSDADAYLSKLVVIDQAIVRRFDIIF